jgi:hypothetical protein
VSLYCLIVNIASSSHDVSCFLARNTVRSGLRLATNMFIERIILVEQFINILKCPSPSLEDEEVDCQTALVRSQ